MTEATQITENVAAGPGIHAGDRSPLLLTFKLRLRDKHTSELNRQARAVNFVWNYCNETQQKAARARRKWLTAVDLQRLMAGASKDLDLHAHTIQKVCQQYDRSRSEKRKPWLRFRGHRSLGWIPFNQGHVRTIAPGKLKFRGVIYETMHWREVPEGAVIRAGSFNQNSSGHWYVNIPIEFPVEVFGRCGNAAVGIDLGLKQLATLSDSRKIDAPRLYRASEAKLATAQRSKKVKRARAIHRKIANRRKDFMHKLSAQLSKEYGLIVVGDVSPSKLSQTRMAKSVLDAGWSDLKSKLAYKTHLRGGRLIEVSEKMTTQTCSECGSAPPSRPRGIAGLSKRTWKCDECGAVHDRDVNAARNILRIGLDTLLEGTLQ